MAFKLFGKKIDPQCEYCAKGKLTSDKTMVLCAHHGIMQKYHHCRKFEYNPLLREPKIAPLLPQFSKDEFEI